MKTYISGFILRLWKEEDGVALAFSITVFLFVFLFGVSVYAVGEIARQRVELQNASDAAAYSAAIVQADTLSRVAVINKAMSWTYVMMSRRQMDYSVDKWLERVVMLWDIDNAKVIQWNALSTCPHPFHRTRPGNYWAGYMGSDFNVFLNKSQMVNINNIRAQRGVAAGQMKSYMALGAFIEMDKRTIKAMNQAEENLLNQLESRLESVVEAAVKANISETPNDSGAGGADIKHCIFQQSPFDYTRILKNNEDDELDFLVHGDFKPNLQQVFQRGIDKWFVRNPANGTGIRRAYQQKFNHLIAEWNWYSIKWIWDPYTEVCKPFYIALPYGSTTVRGQDVHDSRFDGETAKPYVLKENFCERPGAIVVGLSRKLNNPFAFLFAGGNAMGLFKAFTVPGNKRVMWTASASRGGYYTPFDGDRKSGAYEITWQDVGRDKLWNLKEVNWDASFLPLKHAWDKGNARSWQEGAFTVLSEVFNEVGGGSNLGAPPGMNGGAFQPDSARDHVFH